MTEKEILQKKYDAGEGKESDLSFGRTMPFGKYKGMYIYYLFVAHPFYMDWMVKNTHFKFTETELWWKEKVDYAWELRRADALIGALYRYMGSGDCDNIDDPYWIVE